MVCVTTVSEAYADGRATRAVSRAHRRSSVTRRLARLAGRRLPSWPELRSTVLQITGLGCVDAAMFAWDTIPGLVATGVSLLVLEWLAGE